MNNNEKLNSMTIDEKVDFFYKFVDCWNCPFVLFFGRGCELGEYTCKESLKYWLESEVEDE